MNRQVKIIILFTVLAVPSLLFLFLKLFGTNQYDIPIFFQQGVDTVFTDCNFDENRHLVSSFSLVQNNRQKFKLPDHGGIYVVYISQDLTRDESSRVVNQLVRVESNFIDWDDLHFLLAGIAVFDSTGIHFPDLEGLENSEKWHIGFGNPVYINQLARCEFILDFDATSQHTNETVILVDDQRQIRGYYDMTDEDEIDRLKVELRILQGQKSKIN